MKIIYAGEPFLSMEHAVAEDDEPGGKDALENPEDEGDGQSSSSTTRSRQVIQQAESPDLETPPFRKAARSTGHPSGEENRRPVDV
jgi:hypothetical protein